MRAMIAAMVLVCGAAACGPAPPAKLPADLPPPEYEAPRGYDLDGAQKAAPPAAPTPSAAPTAAPLPPAPAPPKP